MPKIYYNVYVFDSEGENQKLYPNCSYWKLQELFRKWLKHHKCNDDFCVYSHEAVYDYKETGELYDDENGEVLDENDF